MSSYRLVLPMIYCVRRWPLMYYGALHRACLNTNIDKAYNNGKLLPAVDVAMCNTSLTSNSKYLSGRHPLPNVSAGTRSISLYIVPTNSQTTSNLSLDQQLKAPTSMKSNEDHQKLPRRGPRRTLDRTLRPAVQWRDRPVPNRRHDRSGLKKVSMKKRKEGRRWEGRGNI